MIMKKIALILLIIILIPVGCKEKKNPLEKKARELKEIEIQLKATGYRNVYREKQFLIAYPETWDEVPYGITESVKRIFFRGDEKDGVPKMDSDIEVKVGITVLTRPYREGMFLDDIAGMELYWASSQAGKKLNGEPTKEKVRLLNKRSAYLMEYEFFEPKTKRYLHRYQLVAYSKFEGLTYSVIGFVTSAQPGDTFLKKYGLDEKIKKHILTFAFR